MEDCSGEDSHINGHRGDSFQSEAVSVPIYLPASRTPVRSSQTIQDLYENSDPDKQAGLDLDLDIMFSRPFIAQREFTFDPLRFLDQVRRFLFLKLFVRLNNGYHS